MSTKDTSRVTDITIEPPLEPAPQPPQDERQKAEREFAQFYQQQESYDVPQLLRQNRRRRLWLYAISILALLLGLALAGFFIFNNQGGGKFGEEAVKVEFLGPAAAPSGQVVEYRLSYTNDQSVDLLNTEINLRYPGGFTFQEAAPQPAAADGTKFSLPRIAAHETGSITIRGQLVGEVGEEKTFGAVLTYEPDNFRAQFAKSVTVKTQIVASVVNVEVSGPTQLPADQTLLLTVTYRNSSANKLTGLVLRLTSPGGFELELPQLEPLSGSNNTWKLPDIEPRGEGKIELRGKFTEAAIAGNQGFRLAIGLVPPEAKDLTVQEEKIFNTTLIKSHLTLSLTANDVSLKSAVDLGQEVVYDLVYSNEGEVSFSDLVLVARLNPLFFDWTSLRDTADGVVDAQAGTITWTKDNLPALEALSAAGSGSLRFSLRTPAVLPAGVTSGPSFKAQLAVRAKQLVGDSLREVSAQSNEVETKVNTQFSLSVEGRYYTDQLVKLGSGPLPPKVGQTTTYVVFWRLSNSWSEVDNIEVNTTLPAGVIWTGQSTVTAGQKVTFNPNTREVRWQLNRLPPGAGVVLDKPEASFEVAVTPEEPDADKILVLTKTTTATGRDNFSGADLIATAKFITTDLDDDLGAQGKGVVVR
ncbi:MAG: hypothetical protein HY974_04410 [Candidatus Kerfeldbacteria bacterium]|nr:hypothetical protein [Candidatus Kerfeldbacteria bacterium]